MVRLLFFVVILGIAAIVLFVIPLKEISVVETYWDKEQQSLSYIKTDSYSQTGISLSLGAIAEAWVSIRNTDNIPGTFDVNFTFNTLSRKYYDSDRLYIQPGETKTAYGMADTSLFEDWNWNSNIVPGTKIVDVQKYRTIYHSFFKEHLQSLTRGEYILKSCLTPSYV